MPLVEDALEALTVGDIDLLLTEAMRGPELAARLAETRPGLTVLFMSGYTEESGGPARAGEPARAFLQEPFTPHDLTRAVREALASRRADPRS